ncbi:tyrosine-type recombinase/integrase [Kitasatospora sp. NPDC052896]|uniref:tyrosine-type recombinase/integrase n=1 Tax=Kitasatospora sp. NPDC052896 TaxID=3364061 RepID=UPI0037C559EF
MRRLAPCAPRAASPREGAGGLDLAGRRLRLHAPGRAPDRARHPNPALQRAAPQRALRLIRFHDLRHSTPTLLLEQGIELVVINELPGHSHVGVTASVYAHVRFRLQRQAIDTLGDALRGTRTLMARQVQDPSADVAVSVATKTR